MTSVRSIVSGEQECAGVDRLDFLSISVIPKSALDVSAPFTISAHGPVEDLKPSQPNFDDLSLQFPQKLGN